MRFPAVLVTMLLAFAGSGCALLSSAGGVGQIMQTMVDPPATLIWASVATSVTSEGIKEKFPRNDREWDEVRKAAARLAEAGSLLKKESRAGGNSEWMRWSQALVDAAADTLRGVEAKSPDQILAAGEKIYNTCIGCHGRYSMMTAPP